MQQLAAWVWLNANEHEKYCGRQFETVEEFRRWLVGQHDMFGTKAHNGFRLFCKVVEGKGKILRKLRGGTGEFKGEGLVGRGLSGERIEWGED